jgi:hypothetical protein
MSAPAFAYHSNELTAAARIVAIGARHHWFSEVS